MKARLRQPLFWIVVVEVIVMFVLFAVSWRVYLAHRPVASAGVAVPSLPASPPAATPRAAPLAPVTARPSPGPAPLRKPAGVPIDLGALNRDQAGLEQAEDAILIRLVRVTRDYLETVVLPAVRRAESVNRTTSPAATQSTAAIAKML